MIHIGDYSTKGTIHIHYPLSELWIGKFTIIAENLTVLLGGEHPTTAATIYPFPDIFPDSIPQKPSTFSKGDVHIGNDCWVGRDVTILSGVTLGDGCIVGTAAVVTKSFPPYSIIGGNPAKLIRLRCSADEVAFLLQLRWWDWPIEQIIENCSLLQGPLNLLTAAFPPTKKPQ